MHTIALHNALPQVFAGNPDAHASEVWRTDVAFEKGQNYLVVAESGTGKSSLCSFIYGYRTDFLGKITFDSTDIAAQSVAWWCTVRSRHIAYLPQELRLFPELTAKENVLLKNSLTGFKSPQQINGLFEQLGIADKMDSLVAKMSIGQQQRVAIIRTLCQPCDFMLLDEPVSHLDDANNLLVARLVMDEAKAQGAAVIATSVGNNLKLDNAKMLML